MNAMAPRSIEEMGQSLKRSQIAVREARSQLRRLDRLGTTLDGLGDKRAHDMLREIRVSLERLVGHLQREQVHLQRGVREAVRKAPKQ